MAHSDRVNDLAFSADGKYLISVSDDNKIKVWDVSHQGLMKVLTKHASDVNVVAVSSNGKTFLTGSDDNTVIVWNFSNLGIRRKFTPHKSDVIGLGILPDGNRVVSVDSTGNLKLWKITGGPVMKAWNTGMTPYSMALSPNGNFVATGHWNIVSIWSLKDGEVGRQIASFTAHSGAVDSLAFSANNTQLISGCSGNLYLMMWNVPSGTRIKKISGANLGNVASLTSSPDGQFMISGGKKGFVKVWNLPAGTLRNKLTIGNVYATAIAVSPDNSIVAVGQDDGKIRLCRPLTKDHLGCLMDATVNTGSKNGIRYTYVENGKTITVTIPDCSCGRPMPPNAVCVCNTVPGSCGCVGDTCTCVGYTCGCQGNCSCVGNHYWYPN